MTIDREIEQIYFVDTPDIFAPLKEWQEYQLSISDESDPFFDSLKKSAEKHIALLKKHGVNSLLDVPSED